jgi:hypothetical protein
MCAVSINVRQIFVNHVSRRCYNWIQIKMYHILAQFAAKKVIRHIKNNFTKYCRGHLDVCEIIIKLFESQKLSEEWELDQQMDFVSRLIELDISNMPLHILDQYSN